MCVLVRGIRPAYRISKGDGEDKKRFFICCLMIKVCCMYVCFKVGAYFIEQ